MANVNIEESWKEVLAEEFNKHLIMAQYNRNNWHHIPGIGGTMATGLSKHTI